MRNPPSAPGKAATEIHIFFHNDGESALLTQIGKDIKELIQLHKGEAALSEAGDKLRDKSEALSDAFQGQKPKE
jgi:hypothetical protein